MSSWTYITGTINVSPAGRTKPESRYILETVLAHLPKVTGSEGNMRIDILPSHRGVCTQSFSEFGEDMWYQRDASCDGWLDTTGRYTLVLEASLRDRKFGATLRELNKFLNRLAKRVMVEDILVCLKDSFWERHPRMMIFSDPKPYGDMYEPDGWTEYLYWEADPISGYPLLLARRMFPEDESIRLELERRERWRAAEKERLVITCEQL